MSEVDDNRLVDYLYGEMDQAEMRAFEDVMQEDAQLSESVHGFESMLDTIRTVETEAPSDHLDSLILAHAREEKPEATSWISRLFGNPKAALALSGACALAVAVILIPQTSSLEMSEGVEAPAMVAAPAKKEKKSVLRKELAVDRNEVNLALEPDVMNGTTGQLGSSGTGFGGGGMAAQVKAKPGRHHGKGTAAADTPEFEKFDSHSGLKSSRKPEAKSRRRRAPKKIAIASRSKNEMGTRSSPKLGGARMPAAPRSASAPQSAPPRSARMDDEAVAELDAAKRPERIVAKSAASEERKEELAVESARTGMARVSPPAARPAPSPSARGKRSAPAAPAAESASGAGQSGGDRELWARNLARTAQKKAKGLIKAKRIGEARSIYLELRPAVRGTMAFFELSLWLAQLEYGQGRYASARKYAQEASRSRDQGVQNKAREVVARVREDQGSPNSRPASTGETVTH